MVHNDLTAPHFSLSYSNILKNYHTHASNLRPYFSMNYLNYMVERSVLRNACIINIHKGMKKVSRLTFPGKKLCCLVSMWPCHLWLSFFSIPDQELKVQ